MQQLPEVPTVSETYADIALASWNGFMAPARTPRPIIDKLARHVVGAAKDPANMASLRALGIEPGGSTPEDFAAQISAEQPRFDAAIKAADLQPK
jgi:tripartite-type tricarboxylate transporter receptor subunit TctC